MQTTVPRATVLIVTRNRRDDLRRALQSVVAQSVPVDIIVIDDASTDGTSDLVRDEFPHARSERVERSEGHVGHRSRGVEMAQTPIVIIIDDDAGFEAHDTVETTLRDFSDPLIGAVAIPFVDTITPDRVRQQAPDSERVWVAESFIGAAHALRREVFLKLNGYRRSLVHFGEEQDYCLRQLAAGYVTRLGTATPGYHRLSPVRNRPWERYYASRNVIFWNWVNAPTRYLIPRLAMLTARECAYAVKYRMPWITLKGLAGGYGQVFQRWSERSAVPADVFRLYQELRSRKAIPLEEIRDRLPARDPEPVLA